MNRNAWIGIVVVVALAVVVRLRCAHRDPVHEGKIRQTAHVRVVDLRRGTPGVVIVGATASFTTHATDQVQQQPCATSTASR